MSIIGNISRYSHKSGASSSTTKTDNQSAYSDKLAPKISAGGAYSKDKKGELDNEKNKQMEIIIEKYKESEEKHKQLMLENKKRRK
jgi:hypothetical protein